MICAFCAAFSVEGKSDYEFDPFDGKSGSVRVYYAHLPDFGVIVLTVAFGKSDRDDIDSQQRKMLSTAVEALKSAIRKRRLDRTRSES
jgi:hypothetical protein